MDTQIFLAAADGSHRTQLTRGEKSATAPEFSPDSRYVYFSSERSGKPNLWRIPVDGGEAEMLTDWKGEIGAFHVSPDGKWVAFAGMEARADEEQANKEKRDFRVIDENPKNHSLWLIAAEPDGQGKRPPRQADEPAGLSRHGIRLVARFHRYCLWPHAYAGRQRLAQVRHFGSRRGERRSARHRRYRRIRAQPALFARWTLSGLRALHRSGALGGDRSYRAADPPERRGARTAAHLR